MKIHATSSSLAVGLFTLAAAVGVANAAPYSLEVKNFTALEEAAVMIRSEMQTVYSPTGDALPFIGTFDASGWTLSITGNMGGRPVSYSATGVYDSANQKTNYTGGGTVGGDTWAGEGFVSFFDVFVDPPVDFPVLLEEHFLTKDTVVDDIGPPAPPRKPDREDQTAKTIKTVDGFVIDDVDYYKTIDGVIVAGPFHEHSSRPVAGSGGASVIIDDAALLGDFSGSTISGVLVPEPSGIVLLAFAGTTAVATRRRRPR
jgi:hypothetical protein